MLPRRLFFSYLVSPESGFFHLSINALGSFASTILGLLESVVDLMSDSYLAGISDFFLSFMNFFCFVSS